MSEVVINISTLDSIKTNTQSDWLGLDVQEEWEKFSAKRLKSTNTSNQEDTVWESMLLVDAMHCAACSGRVEQALAGMPGILAVTANATNKRVKVIWQSSLTKPSSWFAQLAKQGYPALPLLEFQDIANRKIEQRAMLWRLCVAGFCMMQVMMYAYPSYIASAGDITADVNLLLRWASWLLTLPVIFFSAVPFFSQAWQGVKLGQLRMDFPVALGITVTFLVSTAATFYPSGWWGREIYFDSLTMFVFFLLCGRWLELKLRHKTAGSFEQLMHRLPNLIQKRLSNGELKQTALSNVQEGDVLYVRPGEAFSADGVLLSAATHVDEALLTGEATAVAKLAGDQLIAGSYNLTHAVDMRVESTGEQTQYQQLVKLMASASGEKPTIARLADKIAQPFLWTVVLAASLATWYWWPVDHGKAMMAAVAVLIVTCPCALSLATPAAILTAAGKLAKQGVFIKRLSAIERISQIDSIVFDKTGTLTTLQSNVTQHLLQANTGYTEAQLWCLAASIASHSQHPVSKAILRTYQQQANPLPLIVFDQVTETAGQGLTALCQNFPWGVQKNLAMVIKFGRNQFCSEMQYSETQGALGSIKEHQKDAGRKGGQSDVYLSIDSMLISAYQLTERLKPGVVDSIARLKRQGLILTMLSGDHASAVHEVAVQAGMDDYQSALTPEQKLQYVKAKQLEGRQILMVGDGLNDGPVIALANVSVVMGAGVPLTQAQADIMILNGDIALLETILTQAKRCMRIVKQNIAWALVYNLVCIPLAVLGMLPAWLAGLGMAVSSLFVLLNALRLAK